VLHFAEGLRPSSLRLGAILAGGRSRRFGSLKQFAEVGGTLLIERVAESLRRAGAHPVLITGPHVPDLSHLLPCRPDELPGRGPLGGLHTALRWALEMGLPGTLCIACDLPFIAAPLLRRIAEVGEASPDFAVVPESGGPKQVEPLCAWYPASASGEVDARLHDEGRSLAQLLTIVPVRRIPLAEVQSFGDPSTLFLNVNTPADQERAARMDTLLEEAGGPG
jgi:molybdenum cofactor guanylyltransferase